MSTELLLVLLLLVSAVAMFVMNRPRMDAAALIMIVVLPFTGVITVNEALAGFADANVILIAALFVLGEGLVRTGVARRIGDWIYQQAGGSETKLLVLLMVAVSGLGAFMSSTAVVAIFIPIVLRICQNTGTGPRTLMMPLSMAALTSGMLTLVATAPNMVVNAELMRQGGAGFGFFSFSPFGLPVLALAVVYMLFARRLLTGGPVTSAAARRSSLREWMKLHEVHEREYRVRILPGSPLAGRRIEEVSLRAEGVNILAIERQLRGGTELMRPTPHRQLDAGDILLVDVQAKTIDAPALAQKLGVERLPLGEAGRYFSSRTQEVGMVEAIVSAESSLVGKTILETRIQSGDGLTAIGLRRGREAFSENLLEQRLKPGDTLLLFGFWSDVRELNTKSADLVPLGLPAEFDDVLPAPGRAIQAVGCLGLTVFLMATGLLPNVHAALLGCMLMGLFRCVDMPSAYDSISWKTLVLIVGMLPFSLALQRTGGVELAANGILSVAGEASPRMVLTLIFVVTAGLGLFISNTATAILMAPVAVAVANDLGASPYPFAMIVALAASTAFMTPVSSPVNTLVVGPGNYAFIDFVKVGTPFGLLVMAVSVLLVPILLPFR